MNLLLFFSLSIAKTSFSFFAMLKCMQTPQVSKMMHCRDEEKKSISAKVIEEINKWMERFDCLVIGPGLGRDPFLLVWLYKRIFFPISVPIMLTSLQVQSCTSQHSP